MPLIEPKILNVCILDFPLCKIQKSHVTKRMTPFFDQFLRGIVGENFKFIPCLLPLALPWDKNRVPLQRIQTVFKFVNIKDYFKVLEYVNLS